MVSLQKMKTVTHCDLIFVIPTRVWADIQRMYLEYILIYFSACSKTIDWHLLEIQGILAGCALHTARQSPVFLLNPLLPCCDIASPCSVCLPCLHLLLTYSQYQFSKACPALSTHDMMSLHSLITEKGLVLVLAILLPILLKNIHTLWIFSK